MKTNQKTIKNVLLHPNEGRDINFEVSKRILAFLRGKGINTYVPTGKRLDGACELSQEHFSEMDLCIVFGGDGSMIRAAHLMGQSHVPLVGINMGHFGFMAEISEQDAEDSLSQILEGNYHLENRMMLKASVVWEDDGKATESFDALNDLVLRRSDYSGAIRFDVEINGEKVDTMRGDGVILSTPNGSSGYNLSAGGPLMNPTAENIILTPLCNHSLLEHSLVLAPTDRVRLLVERSEYQDAPLFSCDSCEHTRLDRNCSISIEKSDLIFPLVRLREEHFFKLFSETPNN